MPYEPIHHKYRPQTFRDLVGQETIALTLSNALKQEKIAPAYLFTGPRGTGKTSSARILAKSLNCLTTKHPTPDPCGKCEACLAIAKGTALDVMEIDAASNTGVDNIREIIERSRFAPVQCRYKIYAIDECLTGDSLVQTSEGLMRIDNPALRGKQVLSYSESTNTWEYKKVLRWLERGTKKTLTIKAGDREIRCTGNHLIRTETGWIEARNVTEGMKILSPANVDANKNLAFQNAFEKPIATLNWKPNLVENGCQIYNSIQFPQWTTNLEKVKSVEYSGIEPVYDLEVEDNHNFVANGLLVHNCHMLSTAAFNALLKTLEEPPPQVVFILATTDPQRVLSTIISRCQRFDYRRIPLPEMVSHLKYIAGEEKIAIADEALTLIAQIANGGLRDAESLLDQLSLLPDTISVEKVWDLVGAVPEQDLLKLLQAINSNDSLGALQQCRSLLDRGREPIVVLQNLASFYLNLLIAKTAPQHPEMVAVTETCWQQLCTEATDWDTGLILRGQQHLKESETQLKQTSQPRLWLEVTLLGLLPQAHQITAAQPIPTAKSANNNIAAGNNTPTVSKTTPQAKTISPSQSITPEVPPQPEAAPAKQPEAVPLAKKESAPPIATPASKSVEPTPQKPPAPNNFNIEDIWHKVVSCLQPPTTQALLKQQCHLVDFDGNSAIVGISSANLQKLHQGKVPNIEKAFAQVMQHKVRVQLEVASSNNNSAKKNSTPINNAVAKVLTPAPEVNPTAVVSQTSPVETKKHSLTENRAVEPTPSNSVVAVPPPTNNFVPVPKPVSLPSTPSVQLVDNSISPEIDLPDATLDDENDELQQAIANLTQSFEGEVVQMDNAANQSWDVSQTKEIEESVSINDPSRPDIEDYDDEW